MNVKVIEPLPHFPLQTALLLGISPGFEVATILTSVRALRASENATELK